MRAGLAAEFGNADELMIAIQELQRQGYHDLDAFTPHPVGGLEELLLLGRSRINWIVFPLGMGAALGGFFLMWYCNAWSYPINVGGRPDFAIPAFIPITFESGVLGSSLVAFFALFLVTGLPRLTHPLFAVDGFQSASIDHFWLAIGAGDARLELERTADELRQLGAARVQPFGSFLRKDSR
jgi:hypothetical protein